MQFVSDRTIAMRYHTSLRSGTKNLWGWAPKTTSNLRFQSWSSIYDSSPIIGTQPYWNDESKTRNHGRQSEPYRLSSSIWTQSAISVYPSYLNIMYKIRLTNGNTFESLGYKCHCSITSEIFFMVSTSLSCGRKRIFIPLCESGLLIPDPLRSVSQTSSFKPAKL